MQSGVFWVLPPGMEALESYSCRSNESTPISWEDSSTHPMGHLTPALLLPLSVLSFSLVKWGLYKVSIYLEIKERAISEMPL